MEEIGGRVREGGRDGEIGGRVREIEKSEGV